MAASASTSADSGIDSTDTHAIFDASVLALDSHSKGVSGMGAAEAFDRLAAIARHCRVTRMWKDADCISEVDTNDVRLIAADAHAAAAVERTECASEGESTVEARARAVVRSSAHLCEFIRTCSTLGIMQPPDIAKLCAAAEQEETAREEASSGYAASASATRPGRSSSKDVAPTGSESRTGRATAAALDAAAAAAADCKPVAVSMLESTGEELDAEVISAVRSMDKAARTEAVSALTRSPEARRGAAVARFKRQRALKQRLALLRAQERRAIALDRLAEDGVSGRGSEAVAGASLVSDDARRERALIEVSLLLHQAVDDIITMVDEGKMLGRLLDEPRESADSRAYDPDAAASGPGLSVVHIGTDHSMTREMVHATVFGDPRGRSTIPLEVFAEQERRDAEDRAAKQAEAESTQVMRSDQLAQAGLEDDMEKVDAAADADRKWDDWKDSHQRGSGVTKRV